MKHLEPASTLLTCSQMLTSKHCQAYSSIIINNVLLAKTDGEERRACSALHVVCHVEGSTARAAASTRSPCACLTQRNTFLRSLLKTTSRKQTPRHHGGPHPGCRATPGREPGSLLHVPHKVPGGVGDVQEGRGQFLDRYEQHLLVLPCHERLPSVEAAAGPCAILCYTVFLPSMG